MLYILQVLNLFSQRGFKVYWIEHVLIILPGHKSVDSETDISVQISTFHPLTLFSSKIRFNFRVSFFFNKYSFIYTRAWIRKLEMKYRRHELKSPSFE